MAEKQKYGFEKYIRDGQVAVLVSPGYGAGWSTWNTEYGAALLFDRELVELLLADKKSEMVSLAGQKYPNAYLGGLRDIEIEWLAEGTPFYINEYDGSESLMTGSELTFVA